MEATLTSIDVVEADLVEGVFEREAALDFVGLDHGGEDVADGELAMAVAGEPVGDGEDAAEVVGGVAPLGGEPGVVEVEPADDGADVEGGLHGVEDRSWCQGTRAPLVHGEAGDDGAEELGAGGEVEGLQAAAEGVEETVAGGLVG